MEASLYLGWASNKWNTCAKRCESLFIGKGLRGEGKKGLKDCVS